VTVSTEREIAPQAIDLDGPLARILADDPASSPLTLAICRKSKNFVSKNANATGIFTFYTYGDCVHAIDL
jgi:hypothetical protein